MCNVSAYNENVDRLVDYLEHVNPEVDRLLEYEPELYAAFMTAVRPQLGVEHIKSWYKEAEELYISLYDIDLYLTLKYDVHWVEELDYYYEKEVHLDDLVRECAGYWFKNYRD